MAGTVNNRMGDRVTGDINSPFGRTGYDPSRLTRKSSMRYGPPGTLFSTASGTGGSGGSGGNSGGGNGAGGADPAVLTRKQSYRNGTSSRDGDDQLSRRSSFRSRSSSASKHNVTDPAMLTRKDSNRHHQNANHIQSSATHRDNLHPTSTSSSSIAAQYNHLTLSPTTPSASPSSSFPNPLSATGGGAEHHHQSGGPKLSRQASLRTDKQQADFEKEEKRRRRNRESARRARERERSERQLLERAYDANELRIKHLEMMVDELSSELRRHNTISHFRDSSSSHSTSNSKSKSDKRKTSSKADPLNSAAASDRPSWFGAPF